MVQVFITYRLKPGVTRGEYRQWSLELDQPVASSMPGVQEYKIYEVHGAQSADIPWDIVESIRVDSWEAWQEVGQQPEMQPVIEGFKNLADGASVHIVYGTEVAE